MRKLVVLAIVVILVIAAAAALLVSGYFSPERRREQTLRRFSNDGTVVRRSCGLGEAHVDGARWRDLSQRDRERLASAIASWCAEQGGAATLTVIDTNSHAPVARWNGTALEQVP